MSIFGAIKEAIFGSSTPAPTPTPDAASAAATQESTPVPAPAQAAALAEPVDVDAKLQSLWEMNGKPDLDYNNSIVDLMKLLGMDSSLDNRKQLAKELGYAGALDGSAEMNIALHKSVMDQLKT